MGKLTATERKILDLLSQGLTNPEIAQSSGYAQSTVKNHISSIYAKLGVLTRCQACQVARGTRAER